MTTTEIVTPEGSRDSANEIVLVFEQREETMSTIREIMTVDLIERVIPRHGGILGE